MKKSSFALSTLCVAIGFLGQAPQHASAIVLYSIETGTTATSSDVSGAEGIAFEGGELQTTNAGTDFNVPITLDGSTTNTIDLDGHYETFVDPFSDAVSGTPGNITFESSTGSGIAVLQGVNTYTGTTTIDAGASVLLSGSGTIADSSLVTDNGVFDVSGITADSTRINNLAGSGTVAVGTKSLTISDATGSFDGSFTGSGDVIIGNGGASVYVLDGSSSDFTGTLMLQAGRLQLGDATHINVTLGGSVVVGTGTLFSGSGTVDGDFTLNTGASLEVGDTTDAATIGTLTVGGNYTQSSSAALLITVNPTGSSQLVVAGTASLAGYLYVTYDPGTYTNKTYSILTATKGVTGTFDTVRYEDTSNVSGGTSAISYTADGVGVVLTGLADATTGSTGDVVVAPTDTTIFSAMGSSALLGAQATETSILNHIGDSAGKQTTPSGAWASATGSYNRVHGSDTPSFDDDRYGFLAGVDHQVGNYTLGTAFGFDHSVISESDTGDSGTIDSVRAAAYASRFVGPVNLAAVVGGGLDVISQKREFGLEGDARGTHNGGNALAGLQASLPMNIDGFTVSPQLGLRYTYFRADDFYEHGAGGEDLNVGSDTQNSLQPYAGVALSRALDQTSAHPIQLGARLGYAHELLNTQRSINVTSLDGTDFSADGTPMSRNYLSAGLSAGIKLNKATTISVSYDTLFNTSHTSSESGSLNLAYRF